MPIGILKSYSKDINHISTYDAIFYVKSIEKNKIIAHCDAGFDAIEGTYGFLVINTK